MNIVPCLAAEALFVSPLQPSEHPTREAVNAAIEAMVLLHGSDGCAALMAQEYGEHPDVARKRMGWCRTAVDGAFTPSHA